MMSEDQQQRHTNGEDAMDPDHPFDTLLGGVVECGDQLVDTIDKVGDIPGHFRLIDCALHAGPAMPVLLQGLSWISAVAAGGILQPGLKTVAAASATSF